MALSKAQVPRIVFFHGLSNWVTLASVWGRVGCRNEIFIPLSKSPTFGLNIGLLTYIATHNTPGDLGNMKLVDNIAQKTSHHHCHLCNINTTSVISVLSGSLIDSFFHRGHQKHMDKPKFCPK